MDMSPDARDFVKFLCVMDKEKRPSCEEALQHPWLRKSTILSAQQRSASQVDLNGEEEGGAKASVIRHETVGAILEFASMSKMQQTGLLAVAFVLEDTQIGSLRAAFNQFDSRVRVSAVCVVPLLCAACAVCVSKLVHAGPPSLKHASTLARPLP